MMNRKKYHILMKKYTGYRIRVSGFKRFLVLTFISYLLSPICLYAAGNGNMNVKMKIIENTWYRWDDFDSHYWEDPGWGGRPAAPGWITFGSTVCLKLTSNETAAGVMFTRTKTFRQENWRNDVSRVRMSVYVDCPDNTTDLKFEPKDSGGVSIQALYYDNLPAGQWIDCDWDIDETLAGYADVRQLIFAADNLGSNPCTYYFENLRLVKTDETVWNWDDFNDSSNKWIYAGDAVVAAESAITHNGSTMTSNAGALCMGWNSTIDAGTTEAKLETPEYFNISQYTKVKAEIKCTSTEASIGVGFWNDSDGWKNTSVKKVSAANTWETLEWDMPTATSGYWNAVKIIPVIKNTDEVNTGEIYIDNIYFRYSME